MQTQNRYRGHFFSFSNRIASFDCPETHSLCGSLPPALIQKSSRAHRQVHSKFGYVVITKGPRYLNASIHSISSKDLENGLSEIAEKL